MHRWKLSALAAAAFVSAALTPTDAVALALGSLQVQSALGENLRAEIAIPQATAAEMNSLVAQIASPEIFRAQGMDYSGAARSIQVQLHRNADGTASLRLRSNAPIQDPFVDLVVETQWNTGHLARSYTLLLDPPGTRRPAPAPALAPQVSAPTAPAAMARSSYASNSAARQRATPLAAAPSPSTEAAPPVREASVKIRPGDTAGNIANANRPAGVSLDQMLVAMLRSNPSAFINGNVNRIRAGAVVQVPNREQALQTSASEARQIVAAQSRDFNAYRRSLASKAPQAAVQAADRSSGGLVQAHVEDSKAAATTPDKLTLSKGSLQNAAIPEAQLAAQKQADDQDNRLSELQRNLAELNELAQNTSAPAPAAATPAAAAQTSAPAAPEPTSAAAEAATDLPVPAVEISNAAAAQTSDAAAASPPPAGPAAAEAAVPPEGAAAAESPTQPAPAPAATPLAPTPAAQSTATEGLLDNPLVPAGAGLVALLLGLLGYSTWKRRRVAQAALDPSLGNSQLQPDSFFEGSGGQQVDTSNSESGASTMAYAPSQLDGGGDVDPVAEADVYLAYGRDVQAEEILKEALRSQPERTSIHVKLAEIYVKRQDIKALEGVARGMQEIQQAQGPEWQRVVEMGRNMDPTNPFFATAGTGPDAAASKPTTAFAAALNALKPEQAGSTTVASAAGAGAVAQIPDIDLNLNLPDDGWSTPAADTTPAAPATPVPSDDDFAAIESSPALDSQLELTQPAALQDPPTLVQDTQMDADAADALSGLDLDISGFEVPQLDAAATPDVSLELPPSADALADLDLDLDLDLMSESAPATTPPAAPAIASPAEADAGLDFDLGSLDLDLGPEAAPALPAEAGHNLADDPLSTKLDLAQEFNSIGDSEGARALVEEVLAEASGLLKDRAQKMLSEID